jgi:hypothetical protein
MSAPTTRSSVSHALDHAWSWVSDPVSVVTRIGTDAYKKVVQDHARNSKPRENQPPGPTPEQFKAAAHAAYKPLERTVEGHERIYTSPTVLGFRNTSTGDILVGVRGSHQLEDWTDANSRLVSGSLPTSERYRQDQEHFNAVKALDPRARIFLAGHSLGGAIVDRLLEDTDERVIAGRSYNAAYEPHTLIAEAFVKGQNHRVYSTADPIYKSVGHLLPNNDTREPVSDLADGSLLTYPYRAHQLMSMQGAGGANNERFKQALRTFPHPSRS